MSYPRRIAIDYARSPFVSAALEQAFWLASLASAVDATKRDRCVAAVMEMLEAARAKARA